ncbi:MAG TPA: caspase family protein [Burkholderiaceae bacterium]|nr:caspase family protein [Burkholderiaceae bacterium]
MVRTVEAITPSSRHVLCLSAVRSAFRDFIGKYGLERDNRLFIYYAGSGYTTRPVYAQARHDEWMGFLVPVDEAFSMERFASLAREIEAKHALFVFDMCFATAPAFSLDKAPPEPSSHTLDESTTEAVRQFIFAGTTDQKVPDDSFFSKFLVEALAGDREADLNSDGYLTGSELGRFLQAKVTTVTRGAQTPHYGKMSDPRLNRGEFVFLPGNNARPPTAGALPTGW